MHRRGGKRIRMDDPPPEYENPMTPMASSEGGQMGSSENLNISGDQLNDSEMSDSPRKSYSYYNPNDSG